MPLFNQYANKGGDAITGPLTLQSTEAGAPDAFDSTSRLTIQSYQTNGTHNFGEGLRMDLMGPVTKNMIAWRLPLPATSGDLLIVGPSNVGFETDTSGWSTVGSPTSFAVSGAQHASGNQSGKITYATGGANTQGISSTITTFQIGNTYILNAWVYIPTGSPAVNLDVDGLYASSPSTANNSWQKLTTTWVATSTSHAIRIMNNGAATSGQTAFFDEIYVTPTLTGETAIAWAGAHYEAQDGGSVHGHWSIEVPDHTLALQTRLEIKFVNPTTGAIGLDKTFIESHNADFVVDCSNSQHLRLATSASAEKVIEFGNDMYGATPRWQLTSNNTTESGGSAGSNFEVRRYNDAGTYQDSPMIVTRSNGNVTFGGSSGSAGGIIINRNSAGNSLQVVTTANGGHALIHTANDTTSRPLQSSLSGDANQRFVVYADGKHEFGPGSAGRDANLYRSATGVLHTDTALEAGTTVNATTGYMVNAGATSGHVLRGNGTNFVDAALGVADLSDGTTGTGTVVRSISPTFTSAPLAPTAAVNDNSTKLATTAYADRNVFLPAVVSFKDDFLNAGNASVTTATGISLEGAWSTSQISGGTQTIAAVTGAFANPGQIKMTTSAVSGQGVTLYRSGNSIGSFGALGSNAGWEAHFIVKLGATTTTCMRIGLCGGGQQAGDSPTDGFYIEYDTANTGNTDSKFTWVTRASSTSTYSTTNAIAADTNFHHFRIRSTSVGVIGFTVDGGTEQTLNTNISTLSSMVFAQCISRTTAAQNITIDFASYMANTGRS